MNNDQGTNEHQSTAMSDIDEGTWGVADGSSQRNEPGSTDPLSAAFDDMEVLTETPIDLDAAFSTNKTDATAGGGENEDILGDLLGGLDDFMGGMGEEEEEEEEEEETSPLSTVPQSFDFETKQEDPNPSLRMDLESTPFDAGFEGGAGAAGGYDAEDFLQSPVDQLEDIAHIELVVSGGKSGLNEDEDEDDEDDKDEEGEGVGKYHYDPQRGSHLGSQLGTNGGGEEDAEFTEKGIVGEGENEGVGFNIGDENEGVGFNIGDENEGVGFNIGDAGDEEEEDRSGTFDDTLR